MRKIAVLGLGRFGTRLAQELAKGSVEVIVADRNGRLVEEVKDDVTVAVQMDITDEDAMRAQGIGEVDVCVVAIGEGFESTLLTTLIAKRLGAKTVIARAQTALQQEILARVGADQVVRPERQAALELARKLRYPHLEDLIELDEDHSITQFPAPMAFVGKTLVELKLRVRFRVNLVAIRRLVTNGEPGTEPVRKLIVVPEPESTIQEHDILVLVGRHESIAGLPEE